MNLNHIFKRFVVQSPAEDPTFTPLDGGSPVPTTTPAPADPAPADPAPADPAPADPAPADPASADPAPADPVGLDALLGEEKSDPAPTEDPEGNKDSDPNIVPEKYEFKLPEGFQAVDNDALEAFTDLAKEKGYTQAEFDKVTSLYAASLKRNVEAAVQQLQVQQAAQDKEVIANNMKQLREDPNGLRNVAEVKELVNAMKDSHPQAHKYLSTSWLGTVPWLVNFIADAARQGNLNQPNVVMGGSGNKEDIPTHLKMYPEMNKK